MKDLELAFMLETSSWKDLGDPQIERKAAAELRRLAEVNAELLGALEQCHGELASIHSQYGDHQYALEHSAGLRMAYSAIAKATEGTK